MDKHVIYPSTINFDKVLNYEKYLIYKYELSELLTSEHCLTCNQCVQDINSTLLQCENNKYKLNLKSYKENPFFLGYTSEHSKGLLVDGKLLTDEHIRETKRAEFNFIITAKEGTTLCELF